MHSPMVWRECASLRACTAQSRAMASVLRRGSTCPWWVCGWCICAAAPGERRRLLSVAPACARVRSAAWQHVPVAGYAGGAFVRACPANDGVCRQGARHSLSLALCADRCGRQPLGQRAGGPARALCGARSILSVVHALLCCGGCSCHRPSAVDGVGARVVEPLAGAPVCVLWHLSVAVCRSCACVRGGAGLPNTKNGSRRLGSVRGPACPDTTGSPRVVSA